MKVAQNLFAILLTLLLAGCTVDENGIRDPVSEAKAADTRTQTEIKRKNAEVDLTLREQTAYMERAEREAELKAKQVEAETEAYRQRVIAEAEAEARRQTLIVQADTQAEMMRSFSFALSAVFVLGALALVIWVIGYSFARARNAMLSSGYVKIGVDPLTLQPPPLVLTSDGYLLDTRTGERARLRDSAGISRIRLSASMHTTDLALLSRTVTQVARDTKDSRPADSLSGIASLLTRLPDEDTSPQ